MTRLAEAPGERQEVIELPSLSVADVLRTTFALYHRHFLTFALVMGVVVLPMFVIAEASLFASVLWSLEPHLRYVRNLPDLRVATSAYTVIGPADWALRVLASGAVVVI